MPSDQATPWHALAPHQQHTERLPGKSILWEFRTQQGSEEGDGTRSGGDSRGRKEKEKKDRQKKRRRQKLKDSIEKNGNQKEEGKTGETEGFRNECFPLSSVPGASAFILFSSLLFIISASTSIYIYIYLSLHAEIIAFS